jgi:hypothetical protein
VSFAVGGVAVALSVAAADDDGAADSLAAADDDGAADSLADGAPEADGTGEAVAADGVADGAADGMIVAVGAVLGAADGADEGGSGDPRLIVGPGNGVEAAEPQAEMRIDATASRANARLRACGAMRRG